MVAEAGEFAVDPSISPGGVLGGQAHDQGTQASGDGRSTGPDRLGGPAAGDQLAVPAQDGGRCDEQPEGSAGRKQSGEGGDQGAVGPGYSRAWRAPLEHGELVAQNQDLDVLGGVGSGAQHDPAEERGEHLVDQSQRHQRIMPGLCRGRTGRSRAVRAVSGTHTDFCHRTGYRPRLHVGSGWPEIGSRFPWRSSGAPSGWPHGKLYP
jgi:hypothetical protein